MVLAAGQLQSLGTQPPSGRRGPRNNTMTSWLPCDGAACKTKKKKEKQVLRARELDASSHAFFDALLMADVQSAERCSKQFFGMEPTC